MLAHDRLREPDQYTPTPVFEVSNTMAKELEMNDNSTQDQDRQPQQLSGDKPQSAQASGQSSPSERKQCGRPSVRPVTGAAPARIGGQATETSGLQVNKNSAED